MPNQDFMQRYQKTVAQRDKDFETFMMKEFTMDRLSSFTRTDMQKAFASGWVSGRESVQGDLHEILTKK
jgi:hypothetical protein